MSVAPESAAAPRSQTSATASTQKSAPPWESPEWQEAVRQNPGLKPFFDNLESFVELPGGIKKLRKLVMELGVAGKLLDQDERDEPASEMLDKIYENRDDKSKPKKRPSSRFPANKDVPYPVPDSWVWTTFQDVAGIASNLVKPGDFQSMPHIAPNHIEKETGRLLEYRTVAEDKVTSNKHRFYAGQILYSKIRPNLSKAVVVDFDGLCSADMYPIDCFIHVPYLHQYILSTTFLRMVVKSDTRVAMPKTNQTELKKVLVALPPEAEQKRIVSKVSVLLSQLDELSARLRSRQSTTDALLTALIHQILEGA
ncbi:hypothetical protein ACFL2H_12030 [Planctomycetota bacterium]